ncbi:hypothetical protein [Hyphomicrobium sp.]|uniref:hypothetical protein n=1 Tax=Hyphomicrobium sp. TaxID=82 RepID=UPI002E368497|nr:hypothetical protein [Hyphomicrobium sp.]HEX2840271.1 hypothetical protein [Hyphomicrobium sp.]
MSDTALTIGKAMGAVALVLVSAVAYAPAKAAVRICEAPVSSGPVIGSTEQEARKKALDSWKFKALQHGEPYGSWRLAADKLFTCLPRKEGGFECLARGNPCTIEQAPARRELRQKRLGV